VTRKRKKIRTLRGSRTCGGGNAKKRRGAGHKGGRGLAGSGKNKKTKLDWAKKHFPDHLGRRGFKMPQAVMKEEKIMNVQELGQKIDSYCEQGLAEKKGDTISVDLGKLGISKVLGNGNVRRKLNVSAPSFSESAVRKIESAGGTCNASS
jgi:large subunit ribosomal protein L15